MPILNLQQGPAISATWVATLEPHYDDVRLGRLVRAEDKVPYLQPSARSTFGSRIEGWRRQSGIPRPSSAARASVAAATVCRPLLAAGRWDASQLGIVTASTTSATATAVNFETRGLREGWDSVDPLLLPSTLPSALASQVSMALGARGFALSCLVGLLGVFHAVEAAALGLIRGDADVTLVVVAEEQTEVQSIAHATLNDLALEGEFAGALALERGATSQNRLCFVGYAENRNDAVPAEWRNAPHYHVSASHTTPSMQSSGAFRTLVRALLEQHPRVVVTGTVSDLGTACIGFEWST